jgi:hypothetical protein
MHVHNERERAYLLGDFVGGIEERKHGPEDAKDALGVEVALGDEVLERREERGVL